MNSPQSEQEQHAKYWHKSLRIVFLILTIWFLASFGAGILFKEQLDTFTIGNAPLGFWMAQQGSILIFIGLLILYAFLMNKLDRDFGYDKDDSDDESEGQSKEKSS